MKQKITEEKRVFNYGEYGSIYSEETYENIITIFKNNSNQPLSKRGRIILADIGCGSADFGIRFARSTGIQPVLCCDVAENLLRKITDPLAFPLCGDASQLPFRENSLDIVIAAAIIHHFREYPKLVHEFHRVMTRGAFLHIFEPNGASLKELAQYAFGKYFIRDVFTKNEFPISPKKLIQVLHNNGFLCSSIIPTRVIYRKKGDSGVLCKDRNMHIMAQRATSKAGRNIIPKIHT